MRPVILHGFGQPKAECQTTYGIWRPLAGSQWPHGCGTVWDEPVATTMDASKLLYELPRTDLSLKERLVVCGDPVTGELRYHVPPKEGVPSSKHTKNIKKLWKITMLLMGKSTINHHFK